MPDSSNYQPNLTLLPASGVSVIAIDLGYAHTCVIVTGNWVKCWGMNDHGQLGIGSTGDRYSPVDVPGAGRGLSWENNSILN